MNINKLTKNSHTSIRPDTRKMVFFTTGIGTYTRKTPVFTTGISPDTGKMAFFTTDVMGFGGVNGESQELRTKTEPKQHKKRGQRPVSTPGREYGHAGGSDRADLMFGYFASKVK